LRKKKKHCGHDLKSPEVALVTARSTIFADQLPESVGFWEIGARHNSTYLAINNYSILPESGSSG
jgi:hypothetical protein